MFLVGKIITTHGINGEVKVKSETNFPRFNSQSKLYLEKEKQMIPIHINSHRIHQGIDLITFNDYKNINDVIPYIGCSIYTEHLSEELKENEYYYEDLIGLNTYNEENHLIGIVNDIIEVPQGIILEIKREKDLKLIPFVDEFIKEISLDEKKIIIHVIEGLL